MVSGNTGYVQNQYAGQQASSEYWISGRGRMDGGLTVGAGITLDNNNINSGTIASGALAFGNASGEGIGSKRTAGGNQFGIDFFTNSINRMAITNTGNVGIGTSVPGAQLQLADVGAAGFRNLIVGDDTYFTDIDVSNFLGLYSTTSGDQAGLRLGSDGSYIYGDDNRIGVMTTSPRATLNVVHPTSNTTPGGPGGNWVAIIENRQDAADSRNGLSVVTRWGLNASTVFEAASYWNGGAESYTPILSVMGNRRVGIGTTNPTAVLHVVGSGDASTNAYGWLNSGGSTGSCGGCSAAYSIRADGRIRSTEFNAISDKRIKTIVGRTETAELLSIVNDLQVTNYSYIDVVGNGTMSKEGFIAQEVEKVIPSAITKSEDFIPNVYEMARSIETDEANETIIVTLSKEHNLELGNEIKLITESGPKEAEVLAIPSKKSIAVKLSTTPKSVFVYGKKVDDFRAVDYDQLFSIGIGAIQELAKQNAQLKSELEKANAKLSELDDLKASIETLESLILQTSKK